MMRADTNLPTSALRRLAACLSTLLALGGLFSCGTGGGAELAGQGSRPQDESAFMSAQLAELEALPLPEGADPVVWAELKAALRSQLNGLKASLQAPSSFASAPELTVDLDSLTLLWGYACQGDYDQNSEVNIADLAPLGANFGKSTGGQGAFPPGSVESMIDGDSNGELNIADLSPIGSNFGRRVARFNVYRSLSIADLPQSNSGPNGSGAELLGSVEFSEAQGLASQGQLQFSFAPETAAPGWFYFVRPADDESEGTPSNVVSFGAKPGNEAPQALLLAEPQSGTAPLSVNFDASGSTDPDGSAGDITDIVQFAWDFDGDGSVDENTAGPTTTHEYLDSGQFSASVTVFDAQAGFGTDSLEIAVGVAGNTAPQAAISADPLSGQAPLSVSFDASASTDDAGAANLSYEWDFNGDGNFDISSGNVPTIQNVYQIGGSFSATVRVSDGGGLTDNASVSLEVAPPADNLPPKAVLKNDIGAGDVPLDVSFDFSGSSDPDGNIEQFEMDFDGDGQFDFTASGGTSGVDFTYETGGSFTAVLRVTDDRGASDTDSVPIGAFTPGNQPPSALAEASPLEGDAPLLVTLDGSASTDSDGTIVQYDWDFDGDQVFDQSEATPVVQHAYANGGTFSPILRVTDNDGGTGSVISFALITVVDPDNVAPTAAFTFQQVGSEFPQEFEFDASASSDPDGSIASFEWDFDGDGGFEFNSGTESVVTRKYFTQGSFTPVLRVTDNDSTSDESSGEQLDITKGWVVNVLGSTTHPLGSTASVVVSHGSGGKLRTFCIAYADNSQATPARFTSAGSSASNWSTPIEPSNLPSRGAVGLLEASDAPLLFFNLPNSEGNGVRAMRGNDPQGQSFGSPVSVSSLSTGQFSCAMIGGSPAICMSGSSSATYSRALDSLGGSWPASGVVAITNFTSLANSALLEVSGRPAVIAQLGNSILNMSYRRADDATGTTWDGPLILIDSVASDVRSFRPIMLAGKPAVSYPVSSFLQFSHSDDADGSSWPEATTVDSFNSQYRFVNMFLAGTKPAIAAQSMGVFNDVVLFRALDEAGTSCWAEAEHIDTVGDTGTGLSVATAGGRIVLSYIDSTNLQAKAAVFGP